MNPFSEVSVRGVPGSRAEPAPRNDPIKVSPQSTDDGQQLPPDPERMNGDRADWAAAALRQFQCATGCDYEDSLGDLLCDLMHWSDRHNFATRSARFTTIDRDLADFIPAGRDPS